MTQDFRFRALDALSELSVPDDGVPWDPNSSTYVLFVDFMAQPQITTRL